MGGADMNEFLDRLRKGAALSAGLVMLMGGAALAQEAAAFS